MLFRSEAVMMPVLVCVPLNCVDDHDCDGMMLDEVFRVPVVVRFLPLPE